MSKGEDYLERLKDGRNVWLHGSIVRDIAAHPAFAGTVASVAGLLDLQERPEFRERLTFVTESGVRTNRAFQVPVEKEHVFQRGDAFKLWSDATYGVMSRVSGFYRAQLTGWFVKRELVRVRQPQFPDKIKRYYTELRDRDLLITAAGHDPQVNRTKLASELGDLYTAVRIVRETGEGIVVRGAKMIGTGAPYMDEIMVSPHSRKTQEEQRYAVMFAIPASHEGVHLICRDSFAADNEEDYPLSARYDEMDAVLVFDDALIPWERVLIKDDPEAIWSIRSDPFVAALGYHENVARLISKLEFVASVGNELAESIGIKRFAHVQEKLAELFFQVESVKALLLTAEHRSEYDGSADAWAPELRPLVTAKNLGNRYYPRAIELLQQLSGAGMLQVPSSIAELRGPLGAKLQTYYRGADRGAEERVKLLKLAWDLVGSPLGGRHELYERFYAGDPVRTYAAQYAEYDRKALSVDTG